MSAKVILSPLLFLGVVGLLGLPLGFGKAGPAAVQEGQKAPKKLTKSYFGIGDCRRCHTTPEGQDPILCKCDEVRIWEKLDKHKDAQVVLTGPRSQQMAAILHIKDIAREPSCVSCHVGVVGDNPSVTKSFKPSEGVSCIICHGPYKEWVGPHGLETEREMWRGLTRQEKEEKFGLRDLWDPAKRAALCASCHVGDAAEGKVVTHAMYAAGHPPLPGLEVAAFSDAMPRHWEYLAEKKPEVQKILGYDPKRSDLERTQLVVYAGLVVLRESMRLLAEEAETGAAARDPEKRWPELAQFDCYACHHDLKSKSWRQERGYPGTPGRPNMRPWPTALVGLGTLQAAGNDQAVEKTVAAGFQDRLGALTAAFDARPFGEPKHVAESARKLMAWVDHALAEVRKHRIDRDAARRLLRRLCDLPEGKRLDYDSARQIAWSLREILPEAFPGQEKSPKVAAALRALDEQLKLGLPRGQVRVVDSLPQALERISEFEPRRVDRTMHDLAQAIDGKGP
jgi:hypothetical protein